MPPSQWATPDELRASLAKEGLPVPKLPLAPPVGATTSAPSSSSIPSSSSVGGASGGNLSASFMPASTFMGARPGYVFKSGAQGLGYYLEGAKHLPPPPTSSTLRQGQGASPAHGAGSSGGGYGSSGSGSRPQHTGEGLSAAARKYGQLFDPTAVNPNAAQDRNITRTVAGQTWKDETLLAWPEDDFRIFVGDLGNEANDDVLSAAFSRYPSFQMARVVKDKHTHKTKGYGFVSFKDPWDMTKALREMQGKYVGNRPIKVRKSTAQERDTSKNTPLQFNAALGVADKSMKRQLEKGGAVHKKPNWKESKKQKKMLPW